MKYSRDRARLGFDKSLYTQQLSDIKKLGAEYVAIDTPYDEEFYPFLKQWVDSAHSLGLHVWFRGNFSSWEGWFGYQRTLSRSEHKELTQQFIANHPSIFSDKDSFTACPECENGVAGNPLITGDMKGYKQFMIDELTTVEETFSMIHKHVYSNWFSMNPDVAQKILDNDTVEKLHNLIVLDCYVKNSNQLQDRLAYLHKKFPHAKLFLGEFGAPIPHINGYMNDNQQAQFVDSILTSVYQENKVIGVNYWVSSGGSTALFSDYEVPKPVASVIQDYFIPKTISGSIKDELGQPLSGVTVNVQNSNRETTTDHNGKYSLAVPQKKTRLLFSSPYYSRGSLDIPQDSKTIFTADCILKPVQPSIFYMIRVMLQTTLQGQKFSKHGVPC